MKKSMGSANRIAWKGTFKPAKAKKPSGVKLTGIAKARSVGGNAYAKGHTKVKSKY